MMLLKETQDMTDFRETLIYPLKKSLKIPKKTPSHKKKQAKKTGTGKYTRLKKM